MAHHYTLTRDEMLAIDFTQEAYLVSDAVTDALFRKYAPHPADGMICPMDFDEQIYEAAERITLGNLA